MTVYILQQCGFAAAIWPDQPYKFMLFDSNGYGRENPGIINGKTKVIHADHDIFVFLHVSYLPNAYLLFRSMARNTGAPQRAVTTPTGSSLGDTIILASTSAQII